MEEIIKKIEKYEKIFTDLLKDDADSETKKAYLEGNLNALLVIKEDL